DQYIIDQLAGDAPSVQLPFEPVVPVEVELQPKRAVGRYPQVAQPQLRVDEVEVVVQAHRAVGLKIGPATRLVMPRLVRAARLQGREDVHQARMLATLQQDAPDPILFAE